MEAVKQTSNQWRRIKISNIKVHTVLIVSDCGALAHDSVQHVNFPFISFLAFYEIAQSSAYARFVICGFCIIVLFSSNVYVKYSVFSE